MTDAAWVTLSLVERMGGKTLRSLVAHFGSAGAALAADTADLRQVRGVGPKLADRIRRADQAAVEAAMPGWQAAGIHILTLNDDAYPARLRALDDAPPTLFVRGMWPPAWERSAALVGTRDPSPESRRLAQNLAASLVARGYLIVSGLALGVDTSAHLGALAVPEGVTLAALGSGALNIYPHANRQLAEVIARRGALLSELHPLAAPSASTLVARNRLITGLSDLVIVVETGLDGGAMHAARFALAQGRALLAVDNGASGNRALIEAGAGAVPADWRGM